MAAIVQDDTKKTSETFETPVVKSESTFFKERDEDKKRDRKGRKTTKNNNLNKKNKLKLLQLDRTRPITNENFENDYHNMPIQQPSYAVSITLEMIENASDNELLNANNNNNNNKKSNHAINIFMENMIDKAVMLYRNMVGKISPGFVLTDKYILSERFQSINSFGAAIDAPSVSNENNNNNNIATSINNFFSNFNSFYKIYNRINRGHNGEVWHATYNN